jgi:[NiFe] hydrogenase diaphorase moiety large subunit
MEVFRDSDLLATVHSAVARHGVGPHCALQVCQHVQEHFSCVPRGAIPLIARELCTTAGHIVSLVSFYSFLHEVPRGDYDIYLSDSITDQMQGSRDLLNRLCLALGVTPGQPRLDGRVTVATTSCTGLCDQGPAGLVNGRPLTRLDADRVDQIARLVESAVPLAQWPREYFQVESIVHRRDLLLDNMLVQGEALRWLGQHGAEDLLRQLELSGLNGRGGAGFPTATKWRLCREVDSEAHYVVCNADEGEPGTFKDRVLLADCADAVIEGMTLCARCVGAEKGFIYLRGEYAFLRPHLEWVLERRRGDELLGEAILGHPDWCFDIEIHLGAGAYVCGEESALIESLEGKRGIPRSRPPYPVVNGYFGQPTVVNNVETFLAAANVAARGGQWFAVQGNGRGTKLHSVSGDCERPGIYEFPADITVGEIVAAAGGEGARAVQVAGAAGELLLAEEFDGVIDLKRRKTSGSFMIFGPDRELFETTRNFIGFFAHETCGFCAPCRCGTQLARSVVERMAAGRAFGRDREAIDRLLEVTPVMSHCGLGGAALSPLRDLRDKCPERYGELFCEDEGRVLHFDLEGELSEIKRLTGEIGVTARD